MTQLTRPLRRGTSKAVPIVVSAGLAVGVFCGLLFGVGKKSDAVAAAPSTDTTKADDKDKGAAPEGVGATTPPTTPPATTPPPTTPPATPPPATGSAEGSAVASAGSATPATGSATPTVTEAKTNKLTVTIKPDDAAKTAKLIIDGQAVEGMIVELPADKKSVKVEVKASGYRSIDKKLDVAGDTAIELEMAKRPASTGTPPVRPPKRPDKPPGGGGGLIDI